MVADKDDKPSDDVVVLVVVATSHTVAGDGLVCVAKNDLVGRKAKSRAAAGREISRNTTTPPPQPEPEPLFSRGAIDRAVAQFFPLRVWYAWSFLENV